MVAVSSLSPKGVYKLSKTIYIPSGVRIIGYGGKRPVFVLAKQAPGFQEVTRETAKGNTFFGLSAAATVREAV